MGISELTGTKTFLFSDIVGSTSLWDRYPVPMAEALEIHDETVRACIIEAGGMVFTQPGDGFGAAFDRAEDAVGAARSIQEHLGATDWPAPVTIEVRIGVHTGSALRRDGNFFGTAVNRAARICAAAAGGQILTSSATAELCADRPWTFVDVGELALKGLIRPERLRLVSSVNTAAEALLQPTPSRGNLPAPRTGLFGRTSDLAALDVLLFPGAVVTLVGPGGIGKTRLACAAASQASGRFADGVWFVDLSALTTPADVAAAVIDALDIFVTTATPTARDIAQVLRGQSRLVVIDNCEHLLAAAAALVDELSAHAPRCACLATSRQALAVGDERVHRVQPLALEAHGGHSPAMQLLVERVTGRWPDYEPDPAETAALRDICAMVDGVPLALELLASQVGTLGAHQVARELARPEHQGAADPRRDRHRTMTDCVGWSYNILDDDQRKVLDRLSVFVGSFSLDAVHALCSPDLSTERATESVRALVEASLVAVVRHGGTVRYRLLAMTREYAAGQLAAAGTREDMRHRHARYLAAWCAQADRGIRGPDEQRWHQQFEQQWDDIRAAFHHASAQGDHDLMSDIVWHCRYWAEMRLRMEVGDWAETVVRTAPESHAGMPIALSAAAAFARLRDDRRRASEHLDRAEALEARFGAAAEPWVPFERARLTRNSGNSGDLPTLRNVIERGDGDPFWACLIDFVHLQIAVVAEVWNDTTPDPTVVRGVDDALARATALGNPTLLARAYGMLADTERCRSTNDGLDSLERMIELGRTVGNAQVVREAYMDIVQMRGASEDPMSALRLADELITLYSTANAKEPASSIAYATFPALLAVGEHQVAAIIDALLSRGARPEWRQYFTPRHLVEQLAATGGNGAPARLPRDIDELISLIHAAIRRAITRERS